MMKATAVIRRAHFSNTLILFYAVPTNFVPRVTRTANATTGWPVLIGKNFSCHTISLGVDIRQGKIYLRQD